MTPLAGPVRGGRARCEVIEFQLCSFRAAWWTGREYRCAKHAPEVAAYRLGRAAARRGTDMDAAEGRYLARHGSAYINAWVTGWTFYAIGDE